MASESSADRQQHQRQLLAQLTRQIPALIQAIERGERTSTTTERQATADVFVCPQMCLYRSRFISALRNV